MFFHPVSNSHLVREVVDLHLLRNVKVVTTKKKIDSQRMRDQLMNTMLSYLTVNYLAGPYIDMYCY